MAYAYRTSALEDGFRQSEPDTLTYIGFVEKFQDDNLFYTDLFFVDNFDTDFYNRIISLQGRIGVTNGEITRTRLELNEFGKYFNLSGIERIDIYNRSNQHLTYGTFSHIEYVEDLIEGKFVAVFDVNDPNIEQPLFCVGNAPDTLQSIDFSSFRDENLNFQLIYFLQLDLSGYFGIEHYKLDGKLISTVWADTTAYIVESIGESRKVLYKSKSSEYISRMAAISTKINEREILLVEFGMPETDYLWSSVLTFNGNEYEVCRDRRIAMKED
jgi:hypothetical protein